MKHACICEGTKCVRKCQNFAALLTKSCDIRNPQTLLDASFHDVTKVHNLRTQRASSRSMLVNNHAASFLNTNVWTVQHATHTRKFLHMLVVASPQVSFYLMPQMQR